MGLTALAAWAFLIPALPICFFVAYSDLSRMKIPNVAVGAMLVVYAVVGLFVLPFTDYLWHWTHFVVALVVGFALNVARVVGAGDAKFVAAAAPMVALADLRLVLLIFAASLIAAYVTHRVAMRSPLRSYVPHWESWTAGRRFPMGFPLAMALVFYFILVIWLR